MEDEAGHPRCGAESELTASLHQGNRRMGSEDWWKLEIEEIARIAQSPRSRWSVGVRDLTVRVVTTHDPAATRLQIMQMVRSVYDEFVKVQGHDLMPPRNSSLDPIDRFIECCPCPECAGSRALDSVGANLQRGWGRHCELSALAAAPAGLSDAALVAARRRYAKHLDVVLGVSSGDVADADYAIHARHVATGHFIGAERPGKDAIDVGAARVEWVRHPTQQSRDHYRLIWP